MYRCPNCGASISPETTICPACDEDVSDLDFDEPWLELVPEPEEVQAARSRHPTRVRTEQYYLLAINSGREEYFWVLATSKTAAIKQLLDYLAQKRITLYTRGRSAERVYSYTSRMARESVRLCQADIRELPRSSDQVVIEQKGDKIYYERHA